MSFYREREVKDVRKARQCIGCCQQIDVGSRALDCSGHWDGDFWSGTYHVECRAAEIAYNKLIDSYHDEWVPLSEIEWDSWPWLIEEFPAVAERKGVTTARYEKAEAEHKRCFAAFSAIAKAQEPSA